MDGAAAARGHSFWRVCREIFGAIPQLPERLAPLARQLADIVLDAKNFHDATLLVLQEDGTFGPVATFDEALARYPGFVAWG
jgi:hypothetical protein